jgi:hypothetical protein
MALETSSATMQKTWLEKEKAGRTILLDDAYSIHLSKAASSATWSP